jgi:hypothetical protein
MARTHRDHSKDVSNVFLAGDDGLEDFLMLEFFGAGSGFQGNRPLR